MKEKYLGRFIKERITFKAEGTFESYYMAQGWCSEHGYEEGSMCGDLPIGIKKGEYDLPWKWKNMNAKEKNSLDGIIISTDFREAQVEIIIFN
jgi:hypothetical protein